jgi:hypothetical protein
VERKWLPFIKGTAAKVLCGSDYFLYYDFTTKHYPLFGRDIIIYLIKGLAFLYCRHPLFIGLAAFSTNYSACYKGANLWM